MKTNIKKNLDKCKQILDKYKQILDKYKKTPRGASQVGQGKVSAQDLLRACLPRADPSDKNRGHEQQQQIASSKQSCFTRSCY